MSGPNDLVSLMLEQLLEDPSIDAGGISKIPSMLEELLYFPAFVNCDIAHSNDWCAAGDLTALMFVPVFSDELLSRGKEKIADVKRANMFPALLDFAVEQKFCAKEDIRRFLTSLSHVLARLVSDFNHNRSPGESG